MPEEKLTRYEREKIKKREEIHTVAIKLFSEKGYHNVSMHEIAVEAEFAVGTLYKFFKNKEDLYKSLILEQCTAFHRALIKALEEGSNEIEKLHNFVKTKSTIFVNNISIIRLYFAETSGVSFNIRTGLNNDIQKLCSNLLCSLADVFESGIKNKIFLEIAEPYHLAIALDSICNSFLFLWLESPETNPYPEKPEIILNILFKGLIS